MIQSLAVKREDEEVVCVRVFVQCCWGVSLTQQRYCGFQVPKWLTAIFPNERFTVHQLGCVGSRCTGSSKTDEYLSF